MTKLHADEHFRLVYLAAKPTETDGRPSDDALPWTFLARASNQFGDEGLRMESFRLEGIDVVRHVLIGMASASALAAPEDQCTPCCDTDTNSLFKGLM